MAATLLIRNGSGVLRDIAEAVSTVIGGLANNKEGNMVANILVGVALMVGALLGAAGWFTDPNPQAGLHMFILASMVGIVGGLVVPVAVLDAILD